MLIPSFLALPVLLLKCNPHNNSEREREIVAHILKMQTPGLEKLDNLLKTT